MPVYVYRCPDGHEREIIEPMDCDSPRFCELCSHRMWRKPQPFNVNWNGLKPSGGDISQEIRDTIESAPRRRDQIEPHKSLGVAALEKRLESEGIL